MNEEQKRLARELGALAHRLSSEPLFGPKRRRATRWCWTTGPGSSSRRTQQAHGRGPGHAGAGAGGPDRELPPASPAGADRRRRASAPLVDGAPRPIVAWFEMFHGAHGNLSCKKQKATGADEVPV